MFHAVHVIDQSKPVNNLFLHNSVYIASYVGPLGKKEAKVFKSTNILSGYKNRSI